jgi:hypothetical protein
MSGSINEEVYIEVFILIIIIRDNESNLVGVVIDNIRSDFDNNSEIHV